MPELLADTTVFIDYQRGEPAALNLIQSAQSGDISLTYSAVTAAELWVGIKTRQQEIALAALLANADCVSLSCTAGEQAGRWLSSRSAPEQEELLPDALIAASAAERGATVVTRNVRHFSLFYDQVQSY